MQENAYLCWPAETSKHRRRSFILNSPKLGIPKCPSEEEEDVWLPGHWKTKEPQTILYTSSEFLLRHRLFENTLSIDLIVVTFPPYNNKDFSKIMEIVSPLTVSYKKDQERVGLRGFIQQAACVHLHALQRAHSRQPGGCRSG